MRSMKLLAAVLVVTALVAGPVMAEGTVTSTNTETVKPGKHHKKHNVAKQSGKKSHTETPAQ